MADETEKITYEIIVDDSKATVAAKKVADGLKDVGSSAKAAKESALSFSEGLNKVAPGLSGVVTGFQGMTKGALAFIATPIGLVVAALGLAIGALTKYFKGSEEGQNNLNKIMAVGSAIMEKLTDVAENVGKAIFSAFENPKQALLDLWDFVKNNLINRFTAFSVILEGITTLDFKKVANGVLQLGTGVEDVIGKVQKLAEEVVTTMNYAITSGLALAEMQAKLDKDQRSLNESRAISDRKIIELRERAIKEEGDIKRATIAEAIALSQKQSDKEVEFFALKQKQAKLELELNGDDKEALDKLSAANVALTNAKALRASESLRLSKELNSLDDAAAAAEAKRKDDAAAADMKRKQDEYDFNLSILNAEQAAADAAAAKEKAAAADAAATAAADAAKKASTKTRIGLANELAGNLKGLGKQAKELAAAGILYEKGQAISTIISNTAAAVAKSFKASPITFGLPWSAIAIASGAFGIASTIAGATSAIGSLGFAEGGILHGPRHAQGGIPFSVGGRLGFEAEGGEAIINRRSTAMYKDQLSAINVAGGGVGFAVGGQIPFATSDISERIDGDRLFQDMIDVMRSTSDKVLVIEEFERFNQRRTKVIDESQR